MSDTDKDWTFAFADREQCTADLLVGADGTHSSVRDYTVPGVESIFSNTTVVTRAIATASIKFPFGPCRTHVSIIGEGGAFVLAGQNLEGSEMLGGLQYVSRKRSRAEGKPCEATSSGSWTP